MFNNGQRDILSTSLIENWNGQLKYKLSKMEGDKGRKGWLIRLHEYVPPLNMNEY